MSEIIEYMAKDGQKVNLTFEIIKKFLVTGKNELVTPKEMIFFMAICKSRGLNPFKKDCYLIKYDNNPAAIIVSIDYFRSRAKAKEDCLGWESGIIIQLENGNLKYSKGLILDGEKLVGGWFKAKPKGWEINFTHEVPLKPYIKTKSDGKVTHFWRTENQSVMIQKVAESQGLRKLWPDEFQQLFIAGDITENQPEIEFDKEIEENANKTIIDVEGDEIDTQTGEIKEKKEQPKKLKSSLSKAKQSNNEIFEKSFRKETGFEFSYFQSITDIKQFDGVMAGIKGKLKTLPTPIAFEIKKKYKELYGKPLEVKNNKGAPIPLTPKQTELMNIIEIVGQEIADEAWANKSCAGIPKTTYDKLNDDQCQQLITMIGFIADTKAEKTGPGF